MPQSTTMPDSTPSAPNTAPLSPQSPKRNPPRTPDLKGSKPSISEPIQPSKPDPAPNLSPVANYNQSSSSLSSLSPQMVQSETTLLTSYLTLLDSYTTLRSTLSSLLSDAYLSLARANFHAPSGQRYGADSFDGRRNGRDAVLRIRIETGLKEVVVLVQNRARKVEAGGADLESRLAGLELGGGDADGDGDGDEKKVVEEEEEQVPDPLRQFGILVPQTLRTAQGGFESAVEIMMQIVGVQRELVGLEGMIRDQRIRMKDGD